MKLKVAASALTIALLALGILPARAATIPHVLIVILENKGYQKTLGSCSADPYLCSLAKAYADFTNSHGVSHPSEPNYVAFESGSIGTCTTDSSCKADTVTRVDLGGQLTTKGVSWVGWMESMPSACYKGATFGTHGYALKHSFGGFFTDEYTGACHIQPYPGVTKALAALTSTAAPDFVWITPNLLDDMHDGTVQQGDAWLKANIGPILASSWFTAFTSTIVITMDEGPTNNQIPTVVISTAAAGKGAVTIKINHYAMLRTVERTFGCSLLGSAATAPDLSAYFG